jgi:hypothetical protein
MYANYKAYDYYTLEDMDSKPLGFQEPFRFDSYEEAYECMVEEYIYEKEKEKGYSFYRIRKHMVVEYDDSNGHHMNERIEYA